MTNNPLKVEALRSYGINVVEQVPHVIEAQEHNERYLEHQARAHGTPDLIRLFLETTR